MVEAERQPKLDDPVLAAFGPDCHPLTPAGYKKTDKSAEASAKSKTDSGVEKCE
jgi:hypothetical protein